jgi:hypothetical protein
MYRAGQITRDEAQRRMAVYKSEFNAKSREIAKKHGMRPKLFNFTAFCR